MNQCSRTFILAGLVVAILLALHLMPTLTLGGVELRHVNVLSDVLPEAYRSEEAIDYIPSPEPPAPQVAFVADSSAVEIKETRPPGVTMIDDYSAGAPGGMAHFYSALANVSAMERPVRIAYYGDSFIEGDILTCDLRESLQNEFGGNGVGWVDCGSKVAGFRRTVKHQFSGFTEYEVVKKPYSHSHEAHKPALLCTGRRRFVFSKGNWLQTALCQLAGGEPVLAHRLIAHCDYCCQRLARARHSSGRVAISAAIGHDGQHAPGNLYASAASRAIHIYMVQPSSRGAA